VCWQKRGDYVQRGHFGYGASGKLANAVSETKMLNRRKRGMALFEVGWGDHMEREAHKPQLVFQSGREKLWGEATQILLISCTYQNKGGGSVFCG